VTGLDLIKREEFSWLEVLLKQEFQPLSRLLLLLGWTHCHSLRSAQSLLHTLHLQQVRVRGATAHLTTVTQKPSDSRPHRC
jgi:hypothetical protein